MADGVRHDILGRKAQAAQRAFEARGMSLAKALRRSLSRTADVLWDLALVTRDVTVEMLDQDGVIGMLGPKDLLLLLDGPDGAVGLVAMDRQVMTALVEVQTIQQVTQMPLDEDRPLTQTDAAMMAPLIDGTLERLAANLGDHPLHAQLEGYRFGAMLEDARTAALLLDDAAYRAFRAEVDLALGRRQGALSIMLPERKLRRAAGSDPAGDGPGPYEELLSRVPARLDAILARIRIPLHKAGELKPGDVLQLPPDALSRVEISAGRGQIVARGKLGRMSGTRAVRLNWPVVGGGDGTAPTVPAQETTHETGQIPGFDASPPPPPPPEPVKTSEPDRTTESAEELPDLPPLDFSDEAAAFDIDGFDGGENPVPEDAVPMAPLPEIGMSEDFDVAAMQFETED